MNKYIILLALFCIFTSCNGFLEIDEDNVWTKEEIIKNPIRAEGILLKAYVAIPDEWVREDIATDDAVTNVLSDGKLKAATGSWASNSNPFSRWENCYEAIQYINLFLDEYVDVVEWDRDPAVCDAYRKRLTGEAYGLRAYYYFDILKNHSGIGKTSGNYMGFPILSNFQGQVVEIPRATFANSVDFILSDIETAIGMLPARYEDKEGDPVYNETNGKIFDQRMCGDVLRMLKAQVLLLAASPAYADATDETGAPVATWEDAAKAAGELIKANGGLDLLKDGRCEFYIYDEENRSVHPDMLWRKAVSGDKKYDLEQKYFPPSLFGNGEINPSENLVACFPDKNGVPISISSQYDKSNPYENRDPRLAQYIICNGAKLKNQTINTLTGSQDGINKTEKSTRTGYYLLKHTNPNVSLNPGATSGAYHFYPLMRYTELFLIYAEAANNAWGPKADPEGYGFTAYDVMKKLRETAGITDDQYIDTIADNAKTMDTFIRNERRIELCFEGKRFWDIRRWYDVKTMQTPVDGLMPDGVKTTKVEDRAYQEYMIYGPVPYKDARLGVEQNIGWN